MQERDQETALIQLRTLVAAVCIALVAMWAALGEPASASVATASSHAETTVVDDHGDGDGDHHGLPHAHSAVSDLLNLVLVAGHAHGLDAPDGHHHHAAGDSVSILPAQERPVGSRAVGSVRFSWAGRPLDGRAGEGADRPPKR